MILMVPYGVGTSYSTRVYNDVVSDTPDSVTCTVEDCDRPRRSRLWCGKHYERWRKFGDPLTVKTPARNRSAVTERCTLDGCSRAHKALGLCAMHYRRLRKHGDVATAQTNRLHDGSCSVDGCAEAYAAKGFCATHYSRWHDHGDPLYQPRVAGEKRWLTDSGYFMVQRAGHPNAHPSSGSIMEHRWVMAEKLGRPLRQDENVHHINGDRQDNRSENLELWVTRQPPGQRILDVLAWAREIIARYGGEVDAHLPRPPADRHRG